MLRLIQIALQVLRSLLRALLRLLLPSPLTDEPLPKPHAPVVLVPGLMNHGGRTMRLAATLRGRGLDVHAARLGPVSSSHDRACELFYALKGGRVDYGAERAVQYGHARFGPTHVTGSLPCWDAEHPIILLTHSQGAGTALALQRLLADGHFAPEHPTSADWIEAIVCVAAPLNGAASVLGPPWYVPPPSRSLDGTTSQFCGPWTSAVGVLVTLGYILHVLVGWSALVRRWVWDWRLDHWLLTARDLPALVRQRHPILHTTNSALHEITPAGAAARNAAMRPHPRTFYITQPGQITRGRDALPLHTASPLHVAFGALHAWLGQSDAERHTDGLVPVASQRFPAGHPTCHVPQLSLSHAAHRSHCGGGGGGGGTADGFCTLGLRRGVWCHADAAPLDHSASAMFEGGAMFEHVMRVILPAISAQARAEREGSESEAEADGAKTAERDSLEAERG